MNKILILIAALLFAFQFSNAQTEKGTQTIGLDASLNYNKTNGTVIIPYDQSMYTNDTKTTNFSIGPNYSYFIANKLDLGVALSYASALTNQTGTYPSYIKNSSKNYGATIYLRKYFMYTDKIGLRAGPFASYSRQTQIYDYTNPNDIANLNSRSNLWDAGVNLTLVYYPTKKLGVSAMLANLNYEHINTNNTTQGANNQNGLNFAFINDGLSLSLFYVIGSK